MTNLRLRLSWRFASITDAFTRRFQRYAIDRSHNRSVINTLRIMVTSIVIVSIVYSQSVFHTALFAAVASLAVVSPGPATHGVFLFFLKKKLTTFFSHRPLQRVDVFSCLSSVLSKFSYHFFISFGCYPLDAVTRGGAPSDATGSQLLSSKISSKI